MISRRIALLLICVLVAAAGWAQKEKKQKPWTEWNRKEAQKMLSDSPWAREQMIGDASGIFSGPAASSGGSSRRGSRVSVDESVPATIHYCLVSAKPVRQAWARRIELERNASEQLKQQLAKFVETPSDEWITVSVTFDSADPQIRGAIAGLFNRMTTESLKANTYLEVKNGKRVYLDEYRSPEKDLLGARFRFKRTVEGQPFVTPESGELRFRSEVSQSLTLEARFKVADLNYQGVFEY